MFLSARSLRSLAYIIQVTVSERGNVNLGELESIMAVVTNRNKNMSFSDIKIYFARPSDIISRVS